jgi:hypothetical protein
MIYSDELFSVEEKRAMLAKYKGAKNAMTALHHDVSSLQESIQERLRSLQAAGATV